MLSAAGGSFRKSSVRSEISMEKRRAMFALAFSSRGFEATLSERLPRRAWKDLRASARVIQGKAS